eukprot:gene37207-45687_t
MPWGLGLDDATSTAKGSLAEQSADARACVLTHIDGAPVRTPYDQS